MIICFKTISRFPEHNRTESTEVIIFTLPFITDVRHFHFSANIKTIVSPDSFIFHFLSHFYFVTGLSLILIVLKCKCYLMFNAD